MTCGNDSSYPVKAVAKIMSTSVLGMKRNLLYFYAFVKASLMIKFLEVMKGVEFMISVIVT